MPKKNHKLNNADIKINFIIQFYIFIIYWTIVDYHICVFIICARQKGNEGKNLPVIREL
jgi:hypothetical protein